MSTLCGKPVADDRALVMAIVNRTPDSFYDGGANFSDDAAMASVHRAVAEGADMVDIGNKVSLGFLVRLLRALDESSKRGSGSSGLLDVLSLLK